MEPIRSTRCRAVRRRTPRTVGHPAPAGVRGQTLLELTASLVVLGVALSLGSQALAPTLDRVAVRVASGAVTSAVARTRAVAIERMGARLRVDTLGGSLRVVAGTDTLHRTSLIEEHGVELRIGGGRVSAELPYDALGIGRLAAATLVLRRGRALDTVRISSYGRVAR